MNTILFIFTIFILGVIIGYEYHKWYIKKTNDLIQEIDEYFKEGD